MMLSWWCSLLHCLAWLFRNPTRNRSELPTFRFKNVLDYMFFVLVLSPKDGARARNRSICEFDYEHEHHFIEHDHEFKLKDVGNSERLRVGLRKPVCF